MELESYHGQLTDLSQLSNNFTKQMDNPTVVHLTAQETALRQKLFALQQVKKIHFVVKPKEIRLSFVLDNYKQCNAWVERNFYVMLRKEVLKNEPFVVLLNEV